MISDKGYWIGPEAESQHAFDPQLAQAVVTFLKNEHILTKVVDLGCGMGNYVKYFRSNDIYADGYDGNPHTPSLTNGVCGVLDLSESFQLPKYDWVMSLEVGEHLPAKYESVFIDNLHRNNIKGIVLSWAIEGQGGHGHVNERNNDYIRGRFEALGYTSDPIAEFYLRTHATLDWFKNTIMVFRRII